LVRSCHVQCTVKTIVMIDSIDTAPTSGRSKRKLFVDVPDSIGEHAWHERLDKLRCLHAISQLVERHHDSLERVLQGIVELLPAAWRYPEHCTARLSLFGKSYTSERFCHSAYRQTAAIRVSGQVAGTVEVCYARRMPEADDGPFLEEERLLIETVAEHVRTIVERFQAERQLQVERRAVREANAALRKVLAEIEEKKGEIGKSIQANVERIIMPQLRVLEHAVPVAKKQHVAAVRRHLEDITSPFANRLSRAFAALTPVEIEICNLIRHGLSTKEIARLRHVAPATVAKQRERIRRKLQIAGTRGNLATYLRMFAADRSHEAGFPA